jgi:hypothetical protein
MKKANKAITKTKIARYKAKKLYFLTLFLRNRVRKHKSLFFVFNKKIEKKC